MNLQRSILYLAGALLLVSSLGASARAEPFRRRNLSMTQIHEISGACRSIAALDAMTRSVMTCGEEGRLDLAKMGAQLDYLEQTEEPSQFLRTAYVLECIHPEAFVNEGKRPLSVALGYLACGHDARLLDSEKFDAELAALDVPPVLKGVAKARFDEVRALAIELGNAYRKLGPEYQKVLIDAPEEAWQAWSRMQHDNAAAFAEYARIEAALATGSMGRLKEACAKVTSSFDEYIARKNPHTVDEIKAAEADPLGVKLLEIRAACELAAKEHSKAFRALSMSSDGSYAGDARASMVRAAWQAVAKVAEDEPNFPVVHGSAHDRGNEPSWMAPADRPMREQIRKLVRQLTTPTFDEQLVAHVVKSVKPVGEHLEVSFKSYVEKMKEPRNCFESDRVTGILPDGHLQYRLICDFVETTSVTNYPNVAIPKAMAAAVKPGVSLMYAVDWEHKVNGVEVGYPVVVRKPGKGGGTLAYQGIPTTK